MNLTLHYHCDPGHGWIEIERKLAKKIMGEKYKTLSSFSYQKGNLIYLEEDSDAGKFLNCCKENNITYEVCEMHTNSDSPIRSYKSLKF